MYICDCKDICNFKHKDSFHRCQSNRKWLILSSCGLQFRELGRSMMKPQTACEAGRSRRWLSRQSTEGAAAVAWASAAPLIVLALAVASDRAEALRFRAEVQLAAEAASLASAEAVARHPDGDGEGVARRVAAVVFARNAPRGAAGSPTVSATSRGSTAMATATVAYDGVAPSNFGSALGYDAFRVSVSATSSALVAESTPASP
jgi:Flp pilus assembly protein TadG